jgi:small subunit ribosomal protein S20
MRKSRARRDFNRSIRTICGNQVKKVRAAIETGKKVEAEEALIIATRKLQKATKRNILHKNAVSRKISRLAKKVAAMKPQAATQDK